MKCAKCGTEGEIYEAGKHGGLCEKCYYPRTCAKCKSKIPITVVTRTFEGKEYHTDCFRCAKCNGALPKVPVASQGSLLCADCARPCAGCGKPIGNESLEALGSLYHAACLVCSSCKAPLDEIYDADGKPVCEKCA